jgi:hypothetical protein
MNTLPFYIGLVMLFALFIFFQGSSLSIVFGIALFIGIIAVIVIELSIGVKEEGFARNIIEIVAAIAVVLVFWFLLKSVLHTNYPIDVVPSCSMLPQLKRGDLIVLQGVKNISQLKSPVINISQVLYAKFQRNISSEFLSCIAYKTGGNRFSISQLIKPNYTVGLLKNSPTGLQIVPSSYQLGSLIQYTCGAKNITFTNGTAAQEAYTTAVTINGTTIYDNRNDSILVYATGPTDYFYSLGDSYIVHRIFAVLNVNGAYYVLTKGDNNPGLDIQYANYPINATNNVEGKVIYSVPYIGYLKLALSNSFVEPAGCNSTVSR